MALSRILAWMLIYDRLAGHRPAGSYCDNLSKYGHIVGRNPREPILSWNIYSDVLSWDQYGPPPDNDRVPHIWAWPVIR